MLDSFLSDREIKILDAMGNASLENLCSFSVTESFWSDAVEVMCLSYFNIERMMQSSL